MSKGKWDVKKQQRALVLGRLFEAGRPLFSPEIEKGLRDHDRPIPHASLWSVLAELEEDRMVRAVPSDKLSKAKKPIKRYEITAWGIFGLNGDRSQIKKREAAFPILWLKVYVSSHAGKAWRFRLDEKTLLRRFDENPKLKADLVSLVSAGIETAARMTSELEGLKADILAGKSPRT